MARLRECIIFTSGGPEPPRRFLRGDLCGRDRLSTAISPTARTPDTGHSSPRKARRVAVRRQRARPMHPPFTSPPAARARRRNRRVRRRVTSSPRRSRHRGAHARANHPALIRTLPIVIRAFARVFTQVSEKILHMGNHRRAPLRARDELRNFPLEGLAQSSYRKFPTAQKPLIHAYFCNIARNALLHRSLRVFKSRTRRIASPRFKQRDA